MKPARRRAPPRLRPKGSVAVPFAIMLPVMLGFIGLAIDISMVYARNFEMQHLADATAVAAARELDGTLAGIVKARDKATDVATGNYFQFKKPVKDGTSWSTAALYFSDSPTGGWKLASSITSESAAAPLLYAKVDTTALQDLSDAPGRAETSFLRLLGVGASVDAAAVAVAGRMGMQVTPLAICALDNTKFDRRPPVTGPELVEFGYRRGVTYDLLNLNPSGPAPQRFLLDPLADGVTGGPGTHFNDTTLKPFFCNGSIAYGSLRVNSSVHLKAIDGLFGGADWLNSRFGDSSCSREGAPADESVTVFDAYDWMATTRDAAKPAVVSVGAVQALKTSADVSLAPMNGTVPVVADDFGPLWIYSKPVRYVAGSTTGADQPDPTAFSTSDWAELYPTSSGNPPEASGYLSTPYLTQYAAPSAGSFYPERRVLNLALLDCSSGTLGSTGTVLGFGKFFMTQPATSTAVYGEFAGLITVDKLATQVALYK